MYVFAKVGETCGSSTALFNDFSLTMSSFSQNIKIKTLINLENFKMYYFVA